MARAFIYPQNKKKAGKGCNIGKTPVYLTQRQALRSSGPQVNPPLQFTAPVHTGITRDLLRFTNQTRDPKPASTA
jgi:hypothetical protein